MHLAQELDKLDQLGPALILEGVLVGENGLEDGDELRSQLPDRGVFPFVCSC